MELNGINGVNGIKQEFKSFRRDVEKKTGKTIGGNRVYSYEEALEIVREEIKNHLISNYDRAKSEESEIKQKKSDLRRLKEETRDQIRNVILQKTIHTREFPNKMDLIEEMVEDFVGYSILADAWLKNDNVSDIFCLAWNKIYVQIDGEDKLYHRTFRNKKHYHDFIERLLRTTGKVVNKGKDKIVDAEFYEDRLNIVSDVVSPKDMTLTIRKHKENHIKLSQIISQGCMSQELADFLGMCILGETNIIYAGITGSGKTTSLRALLDHYVTLANKRMLVCEDTQELFPENDHTVELVTSMTGNPETEVTLDNLIVTSLRLKPKYIVVGEVRGREATAYAEAAETGHCSITSMHGDSAINIVNRFVTKYMVGMPGLSAQVCERIIGSAIDIVAVQDDIPGTGRRVTSVYEISYDFEKQTISFKVLWEYCFITKKFVIKNKLSPDKANKMLRRGVPLEDLRPWVEGWDDINNIGA